MNRLHCHVDNCLIRFVSLVYVKVDFRSRLLKRSENKKKIYFFLNIFGEKMIKRVYNTNKTPNIPIAIKQPFKEVADNSSNNNSGATNTIAGS